jgi:hypothetical protein
MNDFELLRKHEPIVRLTKGESFFPSGVDEYVHECSLWETDPQGRSQMLVPHGQLDVDRLAEYAEVPPGHQLYLRFVEAPLGSMEYQRWLRDPDRQRLVGPGRLARVPLIFRLAGLLFDLSFLVRGRVAGGSAAAAELKSRAIQARDPRRVYYGRVVRSGGWIALQYTFFYAMNDWRSGFYGANDHEADWEQLFVFLSQEKGGEPQPRWAAYASHDFKGDDLRRRWDDPLLERQGNHPVVYAGAGSHASYFEPGEYVMGIEPEFLRPAQGALKALRKLWNETLGMGSEAHGDQSGRAALSVPFVDYARGDGLSIGPNQQEAWAPEVISDEIGWVHNYRGLWGLDTRDPIGGERAPAGPKYDRDGSVRQSWHDPLGWAGLDKVFPPADLPNEIAGRLAEVRGELDALKQSIAHRQDTLRKMALDVEALGVSEHTKTLHRQQQNVLKEEQTALQVLQARRAELLETQQALESYQQRVGRGDEGEPTAHIRHQIHPEPPLPAQHRAVEVWAAFSSAALLLVLLLLVVLRPDHWFALLVGLGVIFGGIEATARRHLTDYLLTISIVLALVAAAILVVEFWRWVVAFALAAIMVHTILANLRELRR